MINFESIVWCINFDKMRVVDDFGFFLFCILKEEDNIVFISYNDKGRMIKQTRPQGVEAEMFLYTKFFPISIDFDFEEAKMYPLSIN